MPAAWIDSAGRCTESFQRHEELPVPAANPFKTMVEVEVDCRVVLRINQQSKYRHLRTRSTVNCIGQQSTTKLLAVECQVNRQASDPGDRH